jgi:hypothetical protein
MTKMRNFDFENGSTDTCKNAQVVAILMKTGLNNVLLPTLFTVVNNIEQSCFARYSGLNSLNK